jgi:hypothetical protein
MKTLAHYVNAFNDWLAIRGTLALGTMWCVYAFILFSIIPCVAPSTQNLILFISNAFQLVFLPVLLVGQNLLNRSSELRAQEDHAAIMSELAEIKAMHEDLRVLIKEAPGEVDIQVKA